MDNPSNDILNAAIPSPTSTGINSSHMITLFSHTLSAINPGDIIEVSLPIEPFSNVLYTYTYKLPVYSANTQKVTFSIIEDGISIINDLCLSDGNFIGLQYYSFQITVAQGGLLNGLEFNCKNDKTQHSVTGRLLLRLRADNAKIMISNYIITVEINSKTPGYTTHGKPTCNAIDECLEGFKCSGGKCVKCSDNCRYCRIDSTVCNPDCSRHSIRDKITGECIIDYLNLALYSDIEINNISPPRTNRVTLGFWTFISNLESMSISNNIFSIVIKDYFVISIESLSNDKVNVFCSIHEKYNPDLEIQRTSNGLRSKHISINHFSENTIEPAEGRWFHTQCAMSFDHRTFYLQTIINNKEFLNEKPLPLINFYTKIDNDDFFRIIYREGDFLTMKIKNISQCQSKIYLKNLVLFQEYIPHEIHYMYQNLYNIIDDKDDFPEVIYIIPFSEFKPINSLKYKKHPNFTKDTIELKLTSNPKVDSSLPLNFKQLVLLEQNEIFSRIDLSSTSSIPIPINTALLFQINKPMTCVNGNWIHNLKPNQDMCLPNCNLNYISYPGVSDKKGFCNLACSGSMSCPSSAIATIKNSNNYCQAGSTQFYYNCINEDKSSNLYFSSYFRHANVVLDLEYLNLESYFIEFWYFPDFTTDKANYLKAPDDNIHERRNYAFYTNAIKLYIWHNSLHYLRSNGNGIPIQTVNNNSNNLKFFEWNKVVFNVIYNGVDYALQVIINNRFDAVYDLGRDIGQKLTRISFCHLDGGNCGGETIYWASGFYKNLRVWDGEVTQPKSTIQYDDFYPNYQFRLQAIQIFLPFSQFYFKENILSQPANRQLITNPPEPIWQSAYAWNDWNFRLYNFASKFDYIATIGGRKYLNLSPTDIQVCNKGCLRCWSTKECYFCDSGFFLLGTECRQIEYYYFKSPNDHQDQQIITLPKSNECTITFWLKPIGFDANPVAMISYGPNLVLQYEKRIDSVDFGLSLYQLTPLVKLTSVREFRTYFGNWVFISLAYYNNINQAFFPSMMKFEIEKNSYAIDIANLKNINFSFDTLSISPDFFGLVYSLKVYKSFIVGAYGFEQSTYKSLFVKPPELINAYTYLAGSLNDNDCYVSSYFNNPGVYECKPDHDNRFIIKSVLQNQFRNDNFNYVSCFSKCVDYCYNSIETACSCTTQNNNSQMFILNNGALYCQQYKYINWAKAKPQSITVKTARETQRFTMHFWVFAYSYQPNKFIGLEFEWKYHNTISLYNNGNKYYFKCGIEHLSGTVTQELIVDINTWNFLSCAADFSDMKKYYLNTNNANPKAFADYLPDFPSRGFSDNSVTTLTIKDKAIDDGTLLEWGVLFYSQIRLWSEAYFNADFLSRIRIDNTSLFPYILHAWEPEFNYNKEVKDKAVLSTEIMVITRYDSLGIGTNIVSEKAYVPLKLCSEEGEYYDVKTGKCLQFVDLSKMDDFTFKPLPVSFNNNYSMAFWIFTEDYNTLSRGVHLQWTKHMQVSIQKTDLFYAICFPQGYYADSIPNTSLDDKYVRVLNKAKHRFDGTSGVWLWVMCTMSNFKKQFALNGTINPLLNEPMYNVDKGITTAYPLRYFMTESNESSELNIINIQNTKKIYFRSIQLFNDFIPFDYDFRYVDLSILPHNRMISLVFVANFANYDPDPKKSLLRYSTYDAINKNDRTVKLISKGGNLALSANFIFLPLCNPTNSFYDENTKLCENLTSCDVTKLNAWYCMRNNVPLCCKPDHYINVKPIDSSISCATSCPDNIIRAPGASISNSICNTECDAKIEDCPFSGSGQLTSYPLEFNCKGEYYRINYNCIKKEDAPKSALFYSRCYKPPNIYRAISTPTRTKLAEGYFLEFWFKLDTIFNKCAQESSNHFYFYSTPHSLYLDTSSYEWYYQIIGTGNKGLIKSIHNYEWNRIVIKTTLGAKGQSVTVYVNTAFNAPEVIISSIVASTNMQLLSISFCSTSLNGSCTIAGKGDINWGSAYYRNIRVWDISSSSTEIIQAYSNIMFTNIIKSLIMFYPLTIDKMDLNVMTEIINNESIVYKSLYEKARFYSKDEYLFFNYETNFDWVNDNKGVYINSIDDDKRFNPIPCAEGCNRCYTNSVIACYECKSGFVLINQTCTPITSSYLKTPNTALSPIALNTICNVDASMGNLLTLPAFTLTFYMKFLGVIKESTAGTPKILSLSSNTFLAYDIKTARLILSQNNKIAFEDKNFNLYFGKWIPIAIANYISNLNYTVYPNMFTLAVNRIDIPFSDGYTIPSSGVSITELVFDKDVVALFSNMRGYSKFIQGAYGTMTSKVRDDYSLCMHLKLNADKSCIVPSDVVGTISGIECAGDYHEFLDDKIQCSNDLMYLEPKESPPCILCHLSCNELCFNSRAKSCTCDTTKGIFWLRRERSPKITYCERIAYIDFSVWYINPITTMPSSKTPESTIELWMFIYSYNSNPNNFEEINIEWSLHNKIQIANNANTLFVRCYPLYDIDDPTKWTENTSISFPFFQWNLVRCGSDLRFRNYFLNGSSNVIKTTSIPIRGEESTFQIYSPRTVKMNFGFVFLREIKLWQQSNFRYIHSEYM